MTTSDREVVAALEQAIVQRIGEPRFNLWFARRTKFTWDDDQLTVGVPNLHFQEWLQKTFADAVRAAAAEVFGAGRCRSASSSTRSCSRPRAGTGGAPRSEDRGARGPTEASRSRKPRRPQGQEETAARPDALRRPVSEPDPRRSSTARPVRWHKLSEFVVGAVQPRGPRLGPERRRGAGRQAPTRWCCTARSAPARRTCSKASTPACAGPRPTGASCYVTAEDFTNRFVQAMRLGKLAAFRKHFRECDALLVDDLHFLASKQATQEEFLHTFDALLADGRQVVLTCDCHPRLADDFTPELTDRLLGGAVWGLTPPDADTRLAILRAKARPGASAASPDEVLRFLAEQLRGNVRELEGALHSVRHYGRVTGRPIDAGPGARGAGRPAAARGARGAAGRRGRGGVPGAAAGGGRLQSKAAGLGGQPSAHAGDVPGPQAHGGAVQRDRPALRRPQPQHRRRRREEGAAVARRTTPSWPWASAGSACREVVERVERELLR